MLCDTADHQQKAERIFSTVVTYRGCVHTPGFSVHNGVRIARDDEEGKETLAQYIIRNPFSEEKLTYKKKALKRIVR